MFISFSVVSLACSACLHVPVVMLLLLSIVHASLIDGWVEVLSKASIINFILLLFEVPTVSNTLRFNWIMLSLR